MSNGGSSSGDQPIFRQMTPEELSRYQEIPSGLTPDQQILWQQLNDYQRSELIGQYYDSATGTLNDGLAFTRALQQMASGVAPEPYVPDALGVMEHNDNVEVAQQWQQQMLQEAGSAGQDSSSGVMTDGMYYSTDGGQTWRLSLTNGWGLLGGLGLLGVIASIIALLALWPSAPSGSSVPQQQDASGSPATSNGTTIVNPASTGDQYTVDASDPTAHPNMPVAAADPGWEARLEAERMSAIVQGNMALYNQLVQKDMQIYQQYGVNPCDSSHFKEGCQH
jgi:hypothetical protein